jgi:hypothetical protein
MERGTQRKIVFTLLAIALVICCAYICIDAFGDAKKVSSECKVIPTVQPTVVPTLEQNETPTPKPTIIPTLMSTPARCEIEIVADIPWEKMLGTISLEELALQVNKKSIKGWTPGASAIVASKIRGYKKKVGQEVAIQGVFSEFYYAERGKIKSMENVSVGYMENKEINMYRSFLEGKGNDKLEIIFLYRGESVVGVGYGLCIDLYYINPNSGGDGGDSDGGGPGPDPDEGGPGPDPAI